MMEGVVIGTSAAHTFVLTIFSDYSGLLAFRNICSQALFIMLQVLFIY